MDPAWPEFEFSPAKHRLNSTDAKCVEVLHTSGGLPMLGGFGLTQPVGHVDVYVNGGRNHPHCPKLFSKEQLTGGILGQVMRVFIYVNIYIYAKIISHLMFLTL